MTRDAVFDWWRAMQPDEGTGAPGDRAAAARLRRCATVAEAMQLPETMALLRRLGGGARRLPEAALLAAVLAGVRRDAPGAGVARALGPDDPERPETAAMSPLRFRRLMEAEAPDDRLTQFRRMAALLGGTLDVRDLASAVLRWTEPRRIAWTYAYWNAGRPAGTAAEGVAAA